MGSSAIRLLKPRGAGVRKSSHLPPSPTSEDAQESVRIETAHCTLLIRKLGVRVARSCWRTGGVAADPYTLYTGAYERTSDRLALPRSQMRAGRPQPAKCCQRRHPVTLSACSHHRMCFIFDRVMALDSCWFHAHAPRLARLEEKLERALRSRKQDQRHYEDPGWVLS